ncbi:site-specific integrase [bacterium]|nr:site-specific integrase [bacterium]
MSIYCKNGKYYSRFKIHGEQRHFLCQGAKSQREAQAIEDAEKFKLRQQQAGLIKVAKKVTLSKLIELLISDNKINNKDQKHINSKVNSILNYFGKDKDVSTIKRADIENYRGYLKGLNYSNSSINKYVCSLSKSFNLGISNEIIEKNPCSRLKKLKENNEIIRYLTESEEKRLLKELPEYLKPIVICALQTGLRLGNILSLRWEQVDFDYNFIEILKQENKGHKDIKLPLSKKLKEVLLQQPKDCDYIFRNPETMKPYSTISFAWKSALKRANIKNFRFHDLRHTVATRLVENGVDIMTIKEILAHSSIATTQRYMHTKERNKIEAINSL